jgi:hypothetical protein
LRAATGEGWNMTMHDTIDANGWGSALFWISFIVTLMYICLNIIVALLFEKLEEYSVLQ